MRLRRSVAAGALALSAVLGGSMMMAGTAGAGAASNAGQFCKGDDEGKVITADNGKTIQCQYVDGYHRWMVK